MQQLSRVAVLLLLSALLQLNPALWCYDRMLLVQQPWRLWTGHLVHVGWVHWALNSVALVLVTVVFPVPALRHGLLLWLGLGLGISLGLYLGLPDLQQYAGLSGVLHGLVAWGACTWLQQPAERRWGLLVLAGLGLKLMAEATGGSVDTARWIGAPVVVQAHQLGVVLALLAAGLFWGISTARSLWVHDRGGRP